MRRMASNPALWSQPAPPSRAAPAWLATTNAVAVECRVNLSRHPQQPDHERKRARPGHPQQGQHRKRLRAVVSRCDLGRRQGDLGELLRRPHLGEHRVCVRRRNAQHLFDGRLRRGARRQLAHDLIADLHPGGATKLRRSAAPRQRGIEAQQVLVHSSLHFDAQPSKRAAINCLAAALGHSLHQRVGARSASPFVRKRATQAVAP